MPLPIVKRGLNNNPGFVYYDNACGYVGNSTTSTSGTIYARIDISSWPYADRYPVRYRETYDGNVVIDITADKDNPISSLVSYPFISGKSVKLEVICEPPVACVDDSDCDPCEKCVDGECVPCDVCSDGQGELILYCWDPLNGDTVRQISVDWSSSEVLNVPVLSLHLVQILAGP